ncbi:tetratricopeptide repeat protein [Chitinimonas arctica]|uniref:Tetratricopeptide repeat protein n=1 Tax=Chitinimonas arctica TaxID=2594795 RepID=A0A516SA31_9NEIS|nr:tetratricopeptide repeat protein [Chitinimonas arctica]QDQ25013.1 tetratricopeptide repeat protein [Chitinimonas arctica]
MIFRVLLALLLALSAHAADIDSLWDYDKPAVSEARFRAALAKAKAAGNTEQAAELLTQIARAQGLQGRLPEANTTLDALLPELGQLPPAVSVRYLLERGRLINTAGEPKKAWRWFRTALLQAQKHQLDLYLIDAMHMLGIVDNGKATIEWNSQAIALAEQSKAPHAQDWLGSLYNNLGWAYHDQKDYAKALDYLRRAQRWHEQRGTGRPLLVARWSVAKVLRETGEHEKALAIQTDIERAWVRLGEQDGYVYEEIAENLLALGERQQARVYFGRTLAVLSKDEWLVKTEPARLARIRELAE